MAYSVTFLRRAEKDIDRLPRQEAAHVLNATGETAAQFTAIGAGARAFPPRPKAWAIALSRAWRTASP
jgi:hypothetical protein